MTNDPLIFQKLSRELRLVQRRRQSSLVQLLLIVSGCVVLLVALTLHAESYCALVVSAPLTAAQSTCVADNPPQGSNAVRPAELNLHADDDGRLQRADGRTVAAGRLPVQPAGLQTANSSSVVQQ